MHITPLEIRNKTFARAFRGYDAEQVRAFVYVLSQHIEQLQQENTRLTESLAYERTELDRLRDIEHALLKNVHDAEHTAEHVLEQAHAKAQLLLQEAELDARRTLQDAKELGVQAELQARAQVADLRAAVLHEEHRLAQARYEVQRMAEDLLRCTDTAAHNTPYTQEALEDMREKSTEEDASDRTLEPAETL